MTLRRPLLSLLLLLAPMLPASAGGPAEAVAAAWVDAQKLPKDIAPHVRYLSLYAVPQKDRGEFLKVLAFHVNSLSRDVELVIPVLVTPDLVRVNLLDYGWQRDTFEKLAGLDVYFHAQVAPVEAKAVVEVVPEFKEERVSFDGGHTWQIRKVLVGEKKVEKKDAKAVTAHAPWLPGKEIAALALALNSDAPILRADWFFFQTCQQEKRNGTGYYEFLGVKNRADMEKLAALDIEAAKRLRLEIAAIVAESGVATNNRQIIRFQALTGGYWVTLDANASDGKRNAVRNLDGDFVHDAEEIYFVLPNKLYGYGASSDKGELQASVPPDIAPKDDFATGRDTRIQPSLSCVRCHEEGLKPIDDWARSVFTGKVALASPDYAKAKRLRQLYLSDLPGQMEDDIRVFARAVKTVNGLTIKDNAKAYATAFQRYADTSLGMEETAYELGTDAKTWEAALKAYGKDNLADTLLAGLVADKPRRIRREHWFEAYSLAHIVLRGARP